MISVRTRSSLRPVCALVALTSWGTVERAQAQPQPGEAYREYVWSSPPGSRRPQRAQEVFSSVVPYRPKGLQNPPRFTNYVVIDDLDEAIKAEVTVEMWSGHQGTTKRNIALNGKPPIEIPEPALPLDRADGGAPEDYQYRWAPTVSVPLAHLKNGVNSFMFDALAGKAPCFRVWGVVFRIYYGPDKRRPSGRIVSPAPGSAIGDTVELAVEHGSVVRVDYFGHYRDFNIRGDGQHTGWQVRTTHGEPLDHLGTATRKPFTVRWDTRWVPDQDQPMKVVARLWNSDGTSVLTDVVDGLTFGKRSVSVKLFTATGITKNHKSRAGKRATNKVEITEDLRRAKAAKLYLASWAGAFAEEIGVNGTKIATTIDVEPHGFSVDRLDVPVKALRRGTNEPYAFSSTQHHGIDVMWPGMEIKVQFPPRR